jgi:hypothetical protein
MSHSIFRSSVAILTTVAALSHNSGSLSASVTTPGSWGGVAYFEPPRSIGTPIDDLARAYTGFGLAARIEGRLRLDTDASLNAVARELIRNRLARAPYKE